MTHAQKAFARAVASGMNLSDAYRQTFPKSRNWKPAALHKRASEMAARDDVAELIDDLTQAAEDVAVMTSREARKMLTARAREIFQKGGKLLDLTRCINALAQLCGWGAAARYDAAAGVREDEDERADPRYFTDEELAALNRRTLGLPPAVEDAALVLPPPPAKDKPRTPADQTLSELDAAPDGQ